jgi:hypothetical protein
VITAGQQLWRDCSLGRPNLRLSLDFCYFNPFKMIFLILTHHHFKAFGLPNKTGVRACSNLELLARIEKTHLQEFPIPLPNLLALRKITDA